MSKPTGAVCNLDCEYCFFLSKEQLYPDSDFRMAPAVHEAYLEQLLAALAEHTFLVGLSASQPQRTTASAAHHGWRHRPGTSRSRAQPTGRRDGQLCAHIR